MSQKPGWRGRRLESFGSRANFAGRPWHACRQCGGELSETTCLFGKHGECAAGTLRPCSCRRQRNFAGIPRHVFRRKRRLGVCDVLYGDMTEKTLLHAVMAVFSRGSLGPSPTTGNGPRRTRRLRFHLSTERDPFALQYDAEPVVPQKFCRLTPPAQGRVKPSSDGRGGRSKVVLKRSWRTLCIFQGTLPVRAFRHASEPASPQA